MDDHEASGFPGAPIAQVRGVHAYDGKAGLAATTGAWLADLGAYAGMCSIAAWRFQVLPLPGSLGTWVIAVAVIGFVALWIVQEQLLRVTLGQAIWGLRRSGAALRSSLRQKTRPTAASRFVAILLTLGLTLSASVLGTVALLQNPILKSAHEWKLEPYFPAAAEARDWAVTPYYYSIGAWPSRFKGHSILHTLPYEKGPPQQFVGRIVARWDLPAVRAIFEGPKTPDGAPDTELLRKCVLESWGENPGRECLAARRTALERHMSEMRSVKPKKWDLKWFEVVNSAIPPQERARGVYLAAFGENATQERFILINAKGAHQAFILERPSTGETAEAASKAFERGIRSQRFASDLAPGRTWVDRELEGTELHKLVDLKDNDEFGTKMSQLLSVLLSKASVDPRALDAYFHLGGTALLLVKRASSAKRPDWSAAGKPIVLSAWRYAQDVSPEDSRTKQLEQMWLEAKKY